MSHSMFEVDGIWLRLDAVEIVRRSENISRTQVGMASGSFVSVDLSVDDVIRAIVRAVEMEKGLDA